ncbi:unnamed protein product [Cyprideis torosa]|uniref:exodeoxyribonuclease III n=1 Tax=Cyprideis torosa TaxID=163714 RepID=A0A7R8W796_9CRUS|nr:unnamed protein product [Cyprideis torosa]CAG0881988.1 unnamed protein product [Cyprideis torosa]
MSSSSSEPAKKKRRAEDGRVLVLPAKPSSLAVPWGRRLTILSWKLSGIRSWWEKADRSYLLEADIACFQDTRCPEEDLPKDLRYFLSHHGYQHIFYADYRRSRKGYGVAIFSKITPVGVDYLNSYRWSAGQVIAVEFDYFILINILVPNAGTGLKDMKERLHFDENFRRYVRPLKHRKLVLCGGFNVAHEEIDIARPGPNQRKAGFTPRERENFGKLLEEASLTDAFRYLYPNLIQYTYWTKRRPTARAKNVGWRLDYFLISNVMRRGLQDVEMDESEETTTHCPMVMIIDL